MNMHSSIKIFLLAAFLGVTTLAVADPSAEIFSAKMSTPVEARIGDYSDFTLKKENFSLDNGSEMEGWVLHFKASLAEKPNSEDFSLIAVNVSSEVQLMLVRKDKLFPAVGLASGVLNPTDSYDVSIPLPFSYFNEATMTTVNVDDAQITLLGSDKSIQIK